MSPEHMCEYVQKTIEQHQNLYLQFDWKTPVLDSEITLNYDPRKKKAMAIAQVSFQSVSGIQRLTLIREFLEPSPSLISGKNYPNIACDVIGWTKKWHMPI